MSRLCFPFLLMAFVASLVGCESKPTPPKTVPVRSLSPELSKVRKVPAEKEAVDAIKELGGLVQRFEDGVFSVDLSGTDATDAGLEHLKNLANLGVLHLYNTNVTDARLMHLKGMTSLTHLNLHGTKVTDAGLAHILGLNKLEILSLGETQVSDAIFDRSPSNRPRKDRRTNTPYAVVYIKFAGPGHQHSVSDKSVRVGR